MKIIISELPPNINKYIGRNAIWEYQKEKKHYHKLVCEETKGLYPCYTKCNMIVTYHFPTRRLRDTHNLTKCLLDALVEAKIILDDNYMVLNKYTEIGTYDKDNGYVEIDVEEC